MTTPIQARTHLFQGRVAQKYLELVAALDIPTSGLGQWQWNEGYPSIIPLEPLSTKRSALLKEILLLLSPWRSGPFSVCGLFLDAEWISTVRWKLLKPFLRGSRFLDIGAGNGFYLFQILARNPERAVGVDPVQRCALQFDLLCKLAPSAPVELISLSSDYLPELGERFDTVLCLGVLYHHRNPIELLKQIYATLAPTGVLILESVTIPGTELLRLEWGERYTKMRNVSCIPTITTMDDWMRQAGFDRILQIDTHLVTNEEQRRTEFAPYESLDDFLDPSDPSRTIEGFPAPRRTIMLAEKGG